MSKNIVRYLLALLSNQVLSILTQVISVPIFLACWSAPLYGEWLALSSLPAYLGNLDFGMNMAATNQLTHLYARGELDLYHRTQHSVIAYYMMVALGVTLFTGLLAWVLPLTRWLHLHDVAPNTAAWTVWLLAVQMLWRLPIGQIVNIFRTTGRAATSQWISNLGAVIGFAVTIVVVLRGGGMVAVALVQCFSLALMLVATFAGLRNFPKQLRPGVSHFDMKLARELMKPGALFGVIMVAVALNVQAPILVVTHALGGTAVVAFATVRTMANLARQAVGQFNRSIEPEVTRLYALNDFGSLRSLHRLAVAGASTLSIAIVGALWFYGVDVVRVWTHAKVHVQPSFVRLMLIYVVLHVIWLASSTFTVATNNHRQLAWQYLASNGIAIVFATTTIARLGLNAVPIGLILGDAVACYHFVIRDACKICREPYVRFAIRTWLGLICVTTVSLCVGLLSSRIHTGSDVLQWVIAGTLTLVASLFTTWWLWFTDTDRALVVRLFRLPRRALNQA